MNAIRSQLKIAIQEQSIKLETTGKVPFIRVSAPPDGLCAYHSVLGSLSYHSWKQVKRYDNGIAGEPENFKIGISISTPAEGGMPYYKHQKMIQ